MINNNEHGGDEEGVEWGTLGFQIVKGHFNGNKKIWRAMGLNLVHHLYQANRSTLLKFDQLGTLK